MYINKFKNNGRDYLQIMESYSTIKNGKKLWKARVVKNLGPLARFDDGQPDFYARLKQSFKNRSPIVKELEDLAKRQQQPPEQISMTVNPRFWREESGEQKNIGYFLLDSLYDIFGIYDVINLYKSRVLNTDIDLNGIFKTLVFGRVLNPDSKLGTFEDRNSYLFKVTKSDNLNDFYDALDIYNKLSTSIQLRINTKISSTIGRNTELCFYDVTNSFFEIEKNDIDEIDDNGNIIQVGLRKKGLSKENSHQHIVQMGLFMDNNGIPISYRVFPGNCSDQLTLRPAFSETVRNMNIGRVVVVADGGLNSGANTAFLLDNGHGYIFPRSPRKSDKKTKEWMLDDEGYVWNEEKTFKVKSKIYTRAIIDSIGSKRIVNEKIVSYWSKKQYDKENYDNNKVLDYCKQIVKNPRLYNDKASYVKQFLVELQIDNQTGEYLNAAKFYCLNAYTIDEYKKLMGYNSIYTSEIKTSDKDIIDKYHGLSRIEESFRVTKGEIEGRPVFVRTPEHINAHFLICFCALVMYKFIQFKILKYQNKNTLSINGRKTGLSAKRIQSALKSWRTVNLSNGYYVSTQLPDDLKLLLDVFGVEWDLLISMETQLRKLKRDFDKAC